MTKWLQIARDLPLNGQVQTKCPENCGSGEKLSVTHSHKSYWCNCYRCGYTASEWKGKQTLADLARIRELNETANKLELTLDLPNDFTTEIPRQGRDWLHQAGITEQVWRKYRFGYSEYLERVVLPVYDDEDNLIWFQCRALQAGQKPKYLQPARERGKVMFQVRRDTKTNGRVVVVEDILSAIRVGKHENTASLLGTKITTSQAAELGKSSQVITWLDSDGAGRKGSYSIRKTLSLITEVKNIVTKLDPKELSDKDIRRELNDTQTSNTYV